MLGLKKTGSNQEDLLIIQLKKLIHFAIQVLAVLMTVVIFFGVVDLGWDMYQRLTAPPAGRLTIADMLASFGAFMAVLIATEIFVNITVYLRTDVVHAKIVVATALIALARKIIIFDYGNTPVEYVYATGVVVLGISVAYWIVFRMSEASGLPSDTHKYPEEGKNADP